MMKQDISALMDGEMHEEQAEAFFDKFRRHPSARNDWSDYHLIGDVLRQPEHVCRNLEKAFHERLQTEPTVIAPRNLNSQRIRNFALSAAASVMALALVVWMSVQVGHEPAPQIAAVQQNGEVLPVSARADEYLMAHQEFSPSADVHGATTLVYAVAGR